ncbi:MAG: hypothetical protein ABJF10_24225 [Chthoniobacter sp.]|uniref:hypothetical protein n=1 Tax=Chthoniobacter sp. TaxID=2510640 RepID=UPI0032AA46D1
MWKTAGTDAWSFVLERSARSIVFANATFMVAAFLGFCWWGTDTLVHIGFSVFVGLAAITVAYGGVWAAHLFYLTPRKLLAKKQNQVTALRNRINAKDTEILVLKRTLATRTVVKNEWGNQSAA